jgi:uncharacterized caspase-like protein
MTRHALLIGVERYQDERITPLRWASADAKALGRALRDRCGFAEVTVLAGEGTDGEPTVAKILEALRRLTHKVGADDLFLLSFSGHGVEMENEGYLYVADSLSDHPTLNSLPLATLRVLLGRMGARWQAVLVDACRNDPQTGKGDRDNPMGGAFAKNLVSAIRSGGTGVRATAMLSACRRGQRAHEWPDFGHGVCSHFLLEGMNGAAWSGGQLTLRSLASHAEARLKSWSRRSGLSQEPWYEQYGTEDIVLGEELGSAVAIQAETRAQQARTEAERLAGATTEAERRLKELLASEETSRKAEALAALARKEEAERQAREAEASAAGHRARMETLAGQIREIEARLGRSDAVGGGEAGVLEQLAALLDEQEHLAKERRWLEEKALAEKQWQAEAERARGERRERERKEREREMERLAEAEKARSLAARKAAFDTSYPVYLRILKSGLPKDSKLNAWTDLCGRLQLKNLGTDPGQLVWRNGQVELDRVFENSLGMRLVPIKVGLGRPETVLFSIWQTRVKDYSTYAKAKVQVNRTWLAPGFEQGPEHPVVSVSWEDAMDFCAWLTLKEQHEGTIQASQEYRLPTDEEWSWAVGIGRAEEEAGRSRCPQEKGDRIEPGQHPWGCPWGKEWPPKRDAGNYAASINVDPYPFTSPVGSFAANADGIFDLGGNVWEWCEDFINGKSGSRVLRGASWNSNVLTVLASSFRNNRAPDARLNHFGFRVVLGRLRQTQ